MRHMKRGAVLALAITFLLIMPHAAMAGVTYDAVSDRLTVSYDQCTPGGQVSLFLLNSGAPTSGFSVSDVLFMDQLTAGSDGRVEALFINSPLTAFKAVLGGVFPDGGASPRAIGTYTASATRKPLTTPGQLTEIEASAFEGGTFTHVYLGENVATIGARAFAGNTSLIYIYIPDSTVSIASDAFAGCTGLTIGCHEGSVAQAYAQGKNIPYRIVD